MRHLFLIVLMVCAANTQAADKIRATNKELETASHLYSQSMQEAIKKEWLIESDREKFVPGWEFLVMHVILDEAGKAQDTRIIESSGNVSLLEQITQKAVQHAQLQPMPPLLAKGLKAKNLPMPAVLIRVPFVSSADSGLPQPLSFKDWYSRQVIQRVEAKWHQLRALKKDLLIAPGHLELYFLVGPEGKITGLKIVKDKDSYKELNDMTIEAIKSVKPPAMPPEVIEELKFDGLKHLKLEYNVLIY